MYNLDNLDLLLIESISNYLVNHINDDFTSNVFIYLIRSLEDKWSIGILEFELAANPLVYKYRSVVKVSIFDLVQLQKSEEKRQQLLKALIPNELTRYSNLEREAKKDYN